jgi:UDP-2,3-diacylglucosamine pyrophosphatase LpxH
MAAIRFIISDLHIGAGNAQDDFDQDRNFSLFIESLLERKKTELIINGDFVDFVQMPLARQTCRSFSPLGNTEQESRAKLQAGMEGHPAVFDALRSFVAAGHRLVIIPGNHDVDFFWPGVREDLEERLGSPEADLLHFELSGVYRTEGLRVEHGHQYFEDTMFADFTNPFLTDSNGEQRLERCWGNCFLMYFTENLRRKNPFVDNVKPLSSLVWLGIQDETIPFKLQHAYKLCSFIMHVGFPPFKPGKNRQWQGDPYEEERRNSRRRILARLLPFGLAGKMESISDPEGGIIRAVLADAETCEGNGHAGGNGNGNGNGHTEGNGHGSAYGPFGRKGKLALDPLATREDSLSLKARELLLCEDELDVVVFGHDHRYYSNQLQPSLDGKRGKFYINTGTWIPMLFLNRAHRQLHWKDLRDPSLYTQLLTYAEVRHSFGRTTAELKSFDARVGVA